MGATKEEVAELNTGDGLTDLPPGFRFHPTDAEIITHYLSEKVVNRNFSPRAIGEVDLNRCEPWDLPSKAKMGEKEWYFFCQRDRKYPTGMRTNRATDAGYWKATGKDKEIYKGRNSLVGMKKTLVFYLGRAPKGVKTNWVMHEYRLEGKSLNYSPQRSSKDEWAVCRVFHKNTGLKKGPSHHELVRIDSIGMNLALINECLESPPLPSLLESPHCNSSRPSSSFIDDSDGGDIKGIATAVSNPSHLPSAIPTQNHQDLQKCFMTNSAYSGQLNAYDPAHGSMFYPPSASLTPYCLHPTPSNSGYLHQERNPGLASYQTAAAFSSHSKVEQYSNNQSLVSASQDTALSADRNKETSSAVSKQNVGSRSYDVDLYYPQASYLANLWEC